MMHVSKIIILYSLNLYSAVCQLYFNTTGRKKKSNIPINYVRFTIYPDIPAMNREISSINDKYLLETDII